MYQLQVHDVHHSHAGWSTRMVSRYFLSCPASGRSSQVLEDELLGCPVGERELGADAGDVKEWLEHKLHELKKLARV